jgi:serine/threonine protein kinase
MELVDGQTLADRIERSPSRLPITEVLAIARQIVDALEAAHERGVIHRDLTPSHIKIRRDAVIKVLDSPAQSRAAIGIDHSQTRVRPASRTAGAVIGLTGGFVAARSLAGFLYGVPTSDPATFAATLIMLTTVALVACIVPARRAMRVDPITALRSD